MVVLLLELCVVAIVVVCCGCFVVGAVVVAQATFFGMVMPFVRVQGTRGLIRSRTDMISRVGWSSCCWSCVLLLLLLLLSLCVAAVFVVGAVAAGVVAQAVFFEMEMPQVRVHGTRGLI